MPIVFAPSPKGSQILLQRVRTVYVIVDGVAVVMVSKEDRYVSHYETCYRASEFSTKGKVK